MHSGICVSEAFPPDQELPQRQVSGSHALLGEAVRRDYEASCLSIECLESEEQVEQLRELQLEWFPIQYSKSFYS